MMIRKGLMYKGVEIVFQLGSVPKEHLKRRNAIAG
jgi:hypothetical protein